MLQGVCPRGEMTPGEEMTHLAELLFLFFFLSAGWLPGYLIFVIVYLL